ncbi:hypothetical protein AALP_AA4G256200 [Arabis alpina]|uniref:laccase n=2 Tax=Brassicaceae TaxID=3700 RepID=A0A087H5M9_ARAAL|nr:hypothetical protein AALP_AA4G256200 [Arabis alpina]
MNIGEISAATRFYQFKVQTMRLTRLCQTKEIVTINGKFPGPAITAQEDDRIVVKVINMTPYNTTIHWATVYGPLIVYPKASVPYPFKKPFYEHTVLLGEYWLKNVVELEQHVLESGGPPPPADAFTINGQPGPNYICSSKDVYEIKIVPRKTYLLRLINAGINMESFFTIANHRLTIVEVDGEYTKPFTTERVMLVPGQTMNVLVTADQAIGRYSIAMGPYESAKNVKFQNTSAIANFLYFGALPNSVTLPAKLPIFNDNIAVKTVMDGLRSLNAVDVPKDIDDRLFITIGINVNKCNSENPIDKCQGPREGRLAASLNNISFVEPKVSILEAYYKQLEGYFTLDFPTTPEKTYDFVNGAPNDIANDTQAANGTRAIVFEYGSRIQIIFQNTGTLTTENHPIHLHGHSFYVIGYGTGNYDQRTAEFNLEDPPYLNTIGVPVGGWAAIRSLVIALPFRYPSNMGNEHDVYSEEWQDGARESTSSSCRSTKVLASLKSTHDSNNQPVNKVNHYNPQLTRYYVKDHGKTSKKPFLAQKASDSIQQLDHSRALNKLLDLVSHCCKDYQETRKSPEYDGAIRRASINTNRRLKKHTQTHHHQQMNKHRSLCEEEDTYELKLQHLARQVGGCEYLLRKMESNRTENEHGNPNAQAEIQEVTPRAAFSTQSPGQDPESSSHILRQDQARAGQVEQTPVRINEGELNLTDVIGTILSHVHQQEESNRKINERLDLLTSIYPSRLEHVGAPRQRNASTIPSIFDRLGGANTPPTPANPIAGSAEASHPVRPSALSRLSGSREDQDDRNDDIRDLREKLRTMKSQVHQALISAPELDRVIEDAQRTPFTERITSVPVRKDAANCQIFVEYLDGPALEWFSRLEPNSIDDFLQLSFAFVKHYSLYLHDTASDSDLYDLEPQGSKETLRNYMDRFKAVLSKVSVSDSSAISALKQGLWHESEFRRDLVQHKAYRLDDVLHRASGFIRVEEDRAMNSKRQSALKPSTPKPKSAKERIEDDYQEPRQHYDQDYKAKLQVNQVGSSNQSSQSSQGQSNKWVRGQDSKEGQSYCTFHKKYGHATSVCPSLMNVLLGKYNKGEIRVESPQTLAEKNEAPRPELEQRPGFQEMMNVKPMEQMMIPNSNTHQSNTSSNARPNTMLTSNGVSGAGATVSGVSNNNNTAVVVERKARPQEKLNCPRCNSTNTKFCYYNNYSLTQPRYFCKGCRRYWTEGGSLRNVPVGGSSRKNKRSSSSSSPNILQTTQSSLGLNTTLPDLNPPILFSNQINKPKGSSQDLNLLSFPVMQDQHHQHQHHVHMSQFLQMPKMEGTGNNITSSYGSSSSPVSALELLRTGVNVSSRSGINSFMSMDSSNNLLYTSSGFPTMVDYKPSNLSFSNDHQGLGNNNNNNNNRSQDDQGRVLFPFGDQMKELSSSITQEVDHDDNQQQQKSHGNNNNASPNNGYWSGMFSTTGGGPSW